MKKVALMISEGAKQGGLQKYALRVAHAFAEKGCEVTFLTLGEIPSVPQSSVRFVSVGPRLPLSVLNLWSYDRACQRYLERYPVDIAFGFDRTRFQTHLRAGNGVHAAYLERRSLTDSFLKRFSFQVNPLHQSILHFERKAFESRDLQTLFTNSYMVRQEILKHYRTDPDKIEVVHNGVEWQAWQQAFDQWKEVRQELLDTLQLPSSAFYFLFVGHGYQRKGLHFLLKGLQALASQEAHLFVIGRDSHPGEAKDLATKLGLRERVHFLGERRDVLKFYQAADAAVIPSLYDPFANVTVEALAMGLFTLSSRYNGGAEVLSPLNGALIEELTDPASVAQALALAMNQPKRQETALQIRESIRHLDFSHQLQRVVEKTLGCKK